MAPRRPQNAGLVRQQFERAVLGRYGMIKRALKAGKWGIGVGLVLAAGATLAAVVVAGTSDRSLLATIEGTPQDWARQARLIVRRPGGIHCSYPSKDGQNVRLVWGDPREAVQVDVASGQVRPWDLQAEVYQDGCPEISPDEQRLVYATRSIEIMLAADARGGSVKRLTSGYLPRWLPGGQEIAHGFDIRRLAITDISGVTSLLPESAGADETLHDIQIDASTGRLAALFRQPLKARSAVVVASVTSGRLISRVELPVGARGLHFSGASVSLVLREKPYDVVGLVANERTVLRRGVLGTGWLADVATWEKGRFITTGQATYSLSIKDSEGAERVIATSSWFGRLSSTADGSAVFEHQLSHGPVVVAYYDPRSQNVRALTNNGGERGGGDSRIR